MTMPRTILFLADGMADEPMPVLDGRTPVEAADTPGMDAIARDGRCGTLLTLPDAFPTSSDVANMSVLGCDLAAEYCGRGPLEAAGRGIALTPEDLVFRLNLTSSEDGILRDFSGGHPEPDEAAACIDLLDRTLGSDRIRFRSGVSYRNLLILHGADFSAEVHTDKPDDNHGQRVEDHLPRARIPAAEPTAALLRRLIAEAAPLLAGSTTSRARVAGGHAPINGIWPWSGGRAGAMRTLRDRYGISSAVISAVDVIVGLGVCLGMDVIRVPGATGYIDTNYEGKADAAVAALADHDLVFVHVEAIDEVSHAQDLELKLKAIEDFDRRVVSRVMERVPADTTLAVLPDHPVPLRLGKHTRQPVPVAIRRQGWTPDAVTRFSETACPAGALGALRNGAFMDLLCR